MKHECRSKDDVAVDISVQQHSAQRPSGYDIYHIVHWHAHGTPSGTHVTYSSSCLRIRLLLSRLQPIERVAFVVTSRLLPARNTALSPCILHLNTFGGSEWGFSSSCQSGGHGRVSPSSESQPAVAFALQHSFPAAYQSNPRPSILPSLPIP